MRHKRASFELSYFVRSRRYYKIDDFVAPEHISRYGHSIRKLYSILAIVANRKLLERFRRNVENN